MKAQDLRRRGDIEQGAMGPPPVKYQQVAPARLETQEFRAAQRSLHETKGLACRLIQSNAKVFAVGGHRLAVRGPGQAAEIARNRDSGRNLARVEIDEIH